MMQWVMVVALLTLTACSSSDDIPVCCGFPVGSNSCIPLIEGAPCSLDVASDHSTLTFNINGCVEPYDVNVANSKLIKEKQY